MNTLPPKAAIPSPTLSESGGGRASGPNPSDLPDLEPLTFQHLGRLFGIPLLIIGMIVSGAVCVVFLFGAPAAPQARSIDELLQALEAQVSPKTLGMLLPREKEYWQAGLELTKQLGARKLPETELNDIAARIATMIRADLPSIAQPPADPGTNVSPYQVGPQRIDFLIHALGKTGRPAAVDPLIEVARSGQERYALIAMQELGELAALPEAAGAVEAILPLLRYAVRPETRLTATTVLSILAKPDDRQVIDALNAVRLSDEGEVSWSAALALGRLGSLAGKSTLLDLLDRSFWEREEHYQVTDEKGIVHRYKMPPQRIDHWLMAAIDAAANLSEADLSEMIERLKSDPSPAVRGRADKAVRDRA